MEITVLGLNHKTAPIGVRERLAFDAEACAMALAALKAQHPAAEFVILSTCNRVEVYWASDEQDKPGADDVIAFLGRSRGIAVEEFSEYLYFRCGPDAVSHLLTVGSSLDSMVVGESQIISQVKEGYTIACSVQSTGKVLNRLFHAAFETSKEIYSNTTIANRRVSVAGVAVELAGQLFEDIAAARVVIIGAGQMGELLVEHFKHVKCSDIVVINRSLQRAMDLAAAHGIRADKWEALAEHLAGADIVVASAGGQGYLFGKAEFKKAIGSRRKGAVLIVDIAVPRNVDPAVNEIANVYLYSVDDLAAVVEQNVMLRREEVDVAVEIICEKTAEFMDWLNISQIGPLVGQMKEQFERIQRNEMERFFVGPRQTADCRGAMESMVSRVVNKLLHCVIKNMNAEAKTHGVDHAAKMAVDILDQARQIAEDIRSGDIHDGTP
ncbi:MAG: glutamyl-tRNA reductase [Phycisphaerae bacterium]|nr:glutamyl-tRNA reductase [Phycisphaerae bacterium]